MISFYAAYILYKKFNENTTSSEFVMIYMIGKIFVVHLASYLAEVINSHGDISVFGEKAQSSLLQLSILA